MIESDASVKKHEKINNNNLIHANEKEESVMRSIENYFII
jgi:hypothetical protein